MKEIRSITDEELNPLENRRNLVYYLFTHLNGVTTDIEQLSLVEASHRLLMNDPMSVQEAGVVARSLRNMHRENEYLTDEEWFDLYSGDYNSAEEIFGRNKCRSQVWNNSVLQRDDTDEVVYLFREININDKGAKQIRKNGLRAKGIYDYENIERVIDLLLKRPNGMGVGNLPISKFNIFRDVWWMDLDFGFSNPLKLGLSFTTYNNLGNMERIVFGNQMVVARLPSNSVVSEGDKYFVNRDDERTLLFELPSENVVAVVDTRGDRRLALDMAQRIVKTDQLKQKISLFT